MRKRTRYSLLVVLILLAALVAAIWLRKTAPPEIARLLPESDAIIYANLRPIRAATHFDRTAISRSPEYQQFVDATGIQPERDLNAVAFALHRMDNPTGPNGPVAYSEVFEGSFDGAKLARYLGAIATSREDYAGHEIFTIPIEGRQLRVAQLGYDTVAASNMPSTEPIHEMLDRYRAAASPFSGSSLLDARYRDVPLLSTVWGIGHVGLPFSESGKVHVFGFELPIAEDTTLVASLRVGVGGMHLRIEQFAPTEQDAAESVHSITEIVGLLQTVGPKFTSQSQNADAEAVRRFLNSIKLEQHKDRAVLTGTVPIELIRALTANTESQTGLPASNAAGPSVPAR